MTCEEALVLLSGAVDGTNTKEEDAALLAHLESCPDCRALLDSFLETDGIIRALEEEPPDHFCSDVMAQIRNEAGMSQRRQKPAKWIGIAVAAALVLTVGTGSFASHLRTRQTPTVASARTASEPAALSLPAENGLPTDPQALAEALGAQIVISENVLPELEHCVFETLSDGSTLYWLQDAGEAAELRDRYDLPLYAPDQIADSGVSYALVCES